MEPIISTPEVVMVTAADYQAVSDKLKEMTDKFNTQYNKYINFRDEVLASVLESGIDFSYKRAILEDLGIEIPNRKYSFTVYIEISADAEVDDVEYDVANAISGVHNVEDVSVDSWNED
jgi:hypothetical protein